MIAAVIAAVVAAVIARRDGPPRAAAAGGGAWESPYRCHVRSRLGAGGAAAYAVLAGLAGSLGVADPRPGPPGSVRTFVECPARPGYLSG